MKLKDQGLIGAHRWESLLQFAQMNPNPPSPMVKAAVFKTALETGLYTDGNLITRMSRDGSERAEVRRLYQNLLATVLLDQPPTRRTPESLDLRRLFPKTLGPEAAEFQHVGAHDGGLVVGGGLEVVVHRRRLMTLVERHPNAVWHFAGEGQHKVKSLVLLDVGLFEGVILGGLLPVSPKGGGGVVPPITLGGKKGPTWVLCGDELRYERVG